MAYNFPYLKDSTFLKKFEKLKLKEQFVKIIVLNFNNERPIKQVQGKVLSGNFNIDGSSAMRRTGNINLIVDETETNLTNAKNLFSINKKIEVLIGFTNNSNEYLEYNYIWFPQGVYIIMGANISQNSNGINVSLTLHDKMALLNGECGGVLPASVIFNEIEDIDEEGNIIVRQPTIFQIIQELVNHFGGQQLGKIIISDLDNRAKRVMKWIGSNPIYYYTDIDLSNNIYNTLSMNYEEIINRGISPSGIKTISYGEEIGYILTDLVYPNDLISKAGDTIVTILDQIKNTLGNYEYFYDINGNFIFQEIKNYLNKSYASTQINNNINYATDYVKGKSVYTFENSDIITSISSSPQYQQIKNDFMIWGKRKTLNGTEIPIRYHLAIDKKPNIGNSYTNLISYLDSEDNIQKVKKLLIFNDFSDFPSPGNPFDYYYKATDVNKIYKWDAKNGYSEINSETFSEFSISQTNDFRTELYLQGIDSQPFGLASNYYFAELKNEWPKLYDIEHGQFFEDVINHPDEIDFFLDFIDSQAAISQFSIQNIGRRTQVINDDSINCIFQPHSPEIVIIENGQSNTNSLVAECQSRHQQFVQVSSDIYNMLYESGGSKSAYQEIKKQLYQYTSYNEQISLTVLPIYYLQPNTRITIKNPPLNIQGDYIIKSFSLPLGINETMNISCTKALERL